MRHHYSFQPLTALLIIMLIGFSGCYTMTTHYDWDTSADFKALRTYTWAPGQQPLTGDTRIDNNSLLDQRVRQAVDTALASRGYTMAKADPDFWVSYSAAIESKIDVMTMPTYGYSTPYVGPTGDIRDGFGGWSDTTAVNQYDQGTIIIDVVDPKNKRLLWRGAVSDVVDPSRSPVKKQQVIDQAISKVLEDFPPQ